jgi:hypothetical protein
MATFWDTHSLADYDQQTSEVKLTFDPSARRSDIMIDPELMAVIVRIARSRNISPQTLVNIWLQQQVDRVSSQAASPA